MITAVELRNYQSHEHTRLDLGDFTVIIGSSSSGKTSLIRALSTLANNSRGTPYVRHGAKTAQVSITLAGSEAGAEQTQVSVERGKSTSVYELVLPGGEPTKFTKCGMATPEPVTRALGFGGVADTGLWLAGQFDRPYLLDETGAAVARVLGHLTGVSTLFAAVRECNRRSAAHKGTIKDRKAELAELATAAQRHRDLPARREACSAAEAALAAAQQAAERRNRLDDVLHTVRAAQARVTACQAQQRAVPDVTALLELDARRHALSAALAGLRDAVAVARDRRRQVSSVVRDAAGVCIRTESLLTRYTALSSVVTVVRTAAERVRLSVGESEAAASRATQAREEFTRLLTQAGRCPICGAGAEHQHPDLAG